MAQTAAGGAGVPDPVVVAAPAFLAGMADSIEPLMMQEDLREWLQDFNGYSTSPSTYDLEPTTTLRNTDSIFYDIAEIVCSDT